MTNLDVANMAKKQEFLKAYEEAKAAKTEKQAINSAPVRIDEQVAKFEKASFSKKDEQALYKDALSV
jgi:hypothetical protein